MTWFSIVKADDMCCANARAGLLKMIHDKYGEFLGKGHSKEEEKSIKEMRDTSINMIKVLPCTDDDRKNPNIGKMIPLRVLMEQMVSRSSEFFQNEIALEVRPIVQQY